MNTQKTVVITGANGGIGKATAIGLAREKYHVVMLARDSQKSQDALSEVKSETYKDSVDLICVDLASINSINSAVAVLKKEYAKIDVLINNAGIFKRKGEISSDGFEFTMAVNYIATFHLTNSLIPLLENSQQARVINLTSELYKKGRIDFDGFQVSAKYNGYQAYSNSKLLVVLYTILLADRLKNKQIIVNTLHPGVVDSDVFREYPKWFSNFLGLFIPAPAQGAESVIELATSPTGGMVRGAYFYKKNQKPLLEIAQNKKLAEEIWAYTAAQIDLAAAN